MKITTITYDNITYQYTTEHGITCGECDFNGLGYCPGGCYGGVFKKLTTIRKDKIKKILNEK
jgi:hypothetical protein